ncbi:MAG: vitamin K epoxide reductase family protein [Cyclobacteriaceae bacterium]
MDLKLEKVFSLFLRKNYYYVDEKEVKLQLESHPDYPSLRAVTDTLDYLSIEHVAVQVPKEAFDQLPDCFLAMLNNTGEQKNSLVAIEKKGSSVNIFNVEDKESVSLDEFIEKWTGVVIAVEPNVAEGNAANERFKRILSPENIIIAVSAVLVISYLVFVQPTVLSALFLLTSVVGLFVSVLIVKEELGQGSRFTERICNASQATSCQEVINSSGAKIYKEIGLSDLALLYFSALSACVFFGLVSDQLLKLVSVGTLPVVLYTLYYQGVVVKKWCTLCLTLSGVLMIQFVLAIINIDDTFLFEPIGLIGLAMVFSLAALAWYYLKPLVKAGKKGRDTARDLLKLKKDVRVFNTLLQSGTTVEFARNSTDRNIVFGNENAAVRLIAVTNPLCGFCKPAFEQYDKLLRQYGKNVALNMKFNVYLKDPESPGLQISQRVVELYVAEGQGKAYQALRDWFANKDLVAWQKTYGKPENPDNLEILENHKEWSFKNDINYTPATILGNQMYPQEYQLSDLIHFMEELTPQESEDELLEKQ